MKFSILLMAAALSLNAEVRKDIEFARAGEESLKLDASIPEGPGPFPAAIIVHGGGFVRGDRQTYVPPLFAPVSQAGYAWFSIDYRLAPKYRFPAGPEDVERAIEYVFAHAREYKVDPKRIVLIGESAGASINSYVGFRSNKLAGLVFLYGVHDWITRYGGAPALSDNAQQFFGVKQVNAESAPLLARASGIVHAKQDAPPVLCIHGTADEQVPYSQSVQLRDHLQAIGVRCDFYTVEGGGHGMGGWEKDPKLQGWKPALIDWLRNIAAR